MYRVQVWDSGAKRYVDVHVQFDHIGATGFLPVLDGREPTEFGSGDAAFRARDELAEVTDEICCVVDLKTGRRHLDDSDFEQ